MGRSEARASASPCALAGAAARNHGFILMDIYAIDDDGCATCRTGASCFRKYERCAFQRRWAKWRKVNHVLHGLGLNQRAHLSHYLTAPDPPPPPPTLPFNLSLKHWTNGLWTVCGHLLLPASHAPHLASVAFLTPLRVFHNPPSHPDVGGQCDAKCFLASVASVWRDTPTP